MVENYMANAIISIIIETVQLWWELAKEYQIATLVIVIFLFLPKKRK